LSCGLAAGSLVVFEPTQVTNDPLAVVVQVRDAVLTGDVELARYLRIEKRARGTRAPFLVRDE